MSLAAGGPKVWGKVAKRYLLFRSGRTAPIFSSYIVTYRCNLRCRFCNVWRTPSPELGREDAARVVDAICRSGVPVLDFSGGEPFLRRDLEELASRARGWGCAVGVNTNGTQIDEGRAASAASAFDYITVSIDGPEEVHDGIRGVPGTFRKARSTMAALKERGARVGTSSVVTPGNADAILKALIELRGLYDYVIVQPVMPPERGDVRRFVSGLEELEGSGVEVLLPDEFLRGIDGYLNGSAPKICDAMRLYFSVGPTGDVLACGARNDIVLGNLLKRDLNDILEDPPAEALEKVAACSGCWIACTAGTSLAIRHPTSMLRKALGHPPSQPPSPSPPLIRRSSPLQPSP